MKDGGCDDLEVPENTVGEYYRQRQLFQQGDRHAILLEPYLTRSGGGYKYAGRCTGHGPTQRGYLQTLRNCAALLNQHEVKITGLDWQELELAALTKDDFVFWTRRTSELTRVLIATFSLTN
ncbi:MAG: hypothetical protein WCK27_18945 [Verrucomicrobiota bacterium]